MAKPTAEQIHALEKAHKQALANLLQAISFRQVLYFKLGANSEPWRRYAQLVFDIGTKWYKRQMELEKGGATKEGILHDDLFTKAGNVKLKALVKKWDSTGQGIGIIPLIIWAVIALVGFFSADYIVDQLNTTTEEQESLINTTEQYCKTYNLNAEECKKFMVEQNAAVNPPDSGGGIGGTIIKWSLIAGGAYLGFKYLSNKTSKAHG